MKINVERMRYKNDSGSFLFCMLGLIANVIQFMMIYSNIRLQTIKPTVGFKYYMLGLDIVVNIVFMLMCFYVGEELKTYHRNWSIVALVMGVIQIFRIDIFPKHLLKFEYITETIHSRVTICMIISAVMLFIAAVLSFLKSTVLKKFLAEQNEIK